MFVFCINGHSNGHIYAIVGRFLVGIVGAECHVKQVSLSSLWRAYDVKYTPIEKSFSHREIHVGLTHGLGDSACEDFCGQRGCFFKDNFKVECSPRETRCESLKIINLKKSKQI